MRVSTKCLDCVIFRVCFCLAQQFYGLPIHWAVQLDRGSVAVSTVVQEKGTTQNRHPEICRDIMSPRYRMDTKDREDSSTSYWSHQNHGDLIHVWPPKC